MVSYVSLGKWTVQLFGYDAIHEAFVKNSDHFSERKGRFDVGVFSTYLEPGL